MTAVASLRIESAADHPGLVPIVGRWHWEHGGWRDPGGSLESWIEGLRARTNPDRIPATFLAFEGGNLVGSATLVEHDIPDRVDLKHLRPWLAGVYVIPEARGRGVGSAVVLHAESRALFFGVKRLYLYTRGAADFYLRLGWRVLAHDDFAGPITIMARDLE
jgi:GNAT superfamily N-acetyltransferase